jgi:hypothetical protein
MKKYKLFNSKYNDTIIANRWRISDTCHTFLNEHDEIICVWPIHNTIVEVIEPYDIMKTKINKDSINDDTITETNKLDNKVTELK